MREAGCRGKVCLPVAEQCAVRKERVGATPFGNKTYWFNWQSDEEVILTWRTEN